MKLFVVLLAAVAFCGPAFAQDAAPTSTAQAEVPGWSAFVDDLRGLPARMLARLPPAMRDDPQVRAEVGRLALESLAASTLDTVGRDGDYPVFLPTIGQVLNVGQPNADTVYRTAQIRPGGVYRLRGTRGTLRIAMLGEIGPSPYERTAKTGQIGPTRAYHDLNALHVDADDRFDVVLSQIRPTGYRGDWWPLVPTTNKLMIRLVSADWAKERSPTFSIERVDVPMGRPRQSAADLAARLAQLPAQTDFSALLFVDHVAMLVADGYVNTFKTLDVSQMGGLVGQYYYEGAYDLRDDEALIVETKVPANCQYHSMILTNEIFETIDWTDNHSSLNDAQAQPDEDGVLRVVISARDPGVPNWLDTAGYPKGAIQGRWTNCDTRPLPTIRKVALSEVRRQLPRSTGRVSPAERDRTIRDRRTAYDQRPLW